MTFSPCINGINYKATYFTKVSKTFFNFLAKNRALKTPQFSKIRLSQIEFLILDKKI